MARPKGVIQKRNESKYWLPSGIKIKEGQSDIYNKSTELIFIDFEFGEFPSYFKALQDANASTHPKAVIKRRSETNLKLYGGISPMASDEIKNRQKQVIFDKYGVNNPSQNQLVKDKKIETSRKNWGTNNPMESLEVKNKQQLSVFNNYGVLNPMKSEIVKDRLKATCLERYGVENGGSTPEAKLKALETLTQNDSILSSKGELELKEFVQSLGLTAESGYIGGKNPKQLDIKIKELGIALEFNGAYWHSECNKNMHKNYHKDKMIAAKEQGYKLIQIFDFEWENRQNQVKSFLKSALGKNTRVIFGRNTKIEELEKKEANEFLKKYHILGKCNYIKAFGLKFDNELLCLITIGKHHRNNTEFVLSRFVGKEDINVIGGLSKLTSHAVKEFGELTTWIDLRFSDGENWLNNGWELIIKLLPDYFYFDKSTHDIISKQSRRKGKMNTPEGMTEREHAYNDGLRRIYDCGKLKLKFKKV